MKLSQIYLLLSISLLSCNIDKPQKTKDIEAFCIDFNWGEGGPNAFAEPGLWADANPKEHIEWYRDMGVNVVQTFAVSSNGYSWYKESSVPEQPGLKHDFLTEMVKLGHAEGMRVMGYFCIAANTRWGELYPEESYGVPADGHIPLTLKYLDYLEDAIQDAIKKTDIDGFMVDWLFHGPIHPGKRLKWLPCEQQMWVELMGSNFPEKESITQEQEDEFARRAVERCWDRIRDSAKSIKPECTIWLSCYDLDHPQMRGSKIFKEIDWLMNEAGDIASVNRVKSIVGEDTELINCLALWNGANPLEVVPTTKSLKVGLYGFTKPTNNSLLPSIEEFLKQPIDSFIGDEKNIATLVRAYHNLDLTYVE